MEDLVFPSLLPKAPTKLYVETPDPTRYDFVANSLPAAVVNRIKSFVSREAAHRWMAVGAVEDLEKLLGTMEKDSSITEDVTFAPETAGRLLFYAFAMLRRCPGIFNLLPDARSAPTFLRLSPTTQFDVFIHAPIHIEEALALHKWMDECAAFKCNSSPCKGPFPEEGKPVILTSRDLKNDGDVLDLTTAAYAIRSFFRAKLRDNRTATDNGPYCLSLTIAVNRKVQKAGLIRAEALKIAKLIKEIAAIADVVADAEEAVMMTGEMELQELRHAGMEASKASVSLAKAAKGESPSEDGSELPSFPLPPNIMISRARASLDVGEDVVNRLDVLAEAERTSEAIEGVEAAKKLKVAKERFAYAKGIAKELFHSVNSQDREDRRFVRDLDGEKYSLTGTLDTDGVRLFLYACPLRRRRPPRRKPRSLAQELKLKDINSLSAVTELCGIIANRREGKVGKSDSGMVYSLCHGGNDSTIYL